MEARGEKCVGSLRAVVGKTSGEGAAGGAREGAGGKSRGKGGAAAVGQRGGDEHRGKSASPTLRKTAEVGGDAADDVAPEKRKRKDTAGAKMTTAEPGALEAWSRTSRNKGGDR